MDRPGSDAVPGADGRAGHRFAREAEATVDDGGDGERAALPAEAVAQEHLAPANVRLAQRGVRIERRSIVLAVAAGRDGVGAEVLLRDRFSGERRTLAVAADVDCGFRLPSEPMPGATVRAGDCIAPRTVHEAVLEGRRAAHAI